MAGTSPVLLLDDVFSELDPDREAIAVIGAKEGLSHFVLMTIGPFNVLWTGHRSAM